MVGWCEQFYSNYNKIQLYDLDIWLDLHVNDIAISTVVDTKQFLLKAGFVP